MITVRITGLDPLIRKFANSPIVLEREVRRALQDSIAMVETESAKRTPVATGLLRSSIGGAQGYKWVRGWRASVGTNVKYAKYVHEGHGRHKVGERKFMEKGAKASEQFISQSMERAVDRVARHITSK